MQYKDMKKRSLKPDANLEILADSPQTGADGTPADPPQDRANQKTSASRPDKQKAAILRILRFARPHCGFLILSLLCALIHVAAQLLAPVFIGKAIDYVIGPGEVAFDRVFFYVVYLMFTVGAAAIFQYLTSTLAAVAAHRTVSDIRTVAFKKLNSVPLKTIGKASHGDVIARVTADAERISDGLIQGFTQLFSGSAVIIGTLAFMLNLNALVGLAVIVITPLSVALAFLIAKFGHKMFSSQFKAEGALSGLSEEFISSQNLIKLLGCQEPCEEKFGKANGEIKKYGTKAVFISALVNPSTRLINGFVYVSVCVLGALLIMKSGGAEGALTVGGLSTFLSYAMQYAKPFNEITSVITEMQAAAVSSRRVLEVLDSADEPDDSILPSLTDAKVFAAITTGAADEMTGVTSATPAATVINGTAHTAASGVTGAVEFKDVDFSYTEQPFIQSFNLNVKSGQRVAIVGKTGCGKTTLISLLMRFYDIHSGAITIDGTDINTVTRASVRQNIGMVLQDTWVFRGTVRQNIAYGKENAPLEEIKEAAKKARIDGFISNLKDGYDTILEPSGLSQGQIQLLCIARVFLTLPPMVILDEATSSIDARTELKIQEALKEMMTGHTSFIVAHRLSTIREADIILVMDEGRIAESGTHSELLSLDGYYAALLRASENVESA